MYKTNARPFIKWAGGKGSLLKQLDLLLPSELKENKIENYYEPFLGNGAMFFYIKQTYNVKNIYLYDKNPDIVILFIVVQNHISKLLSALLDLEDKFMSLKFKDKKDLFYEIRHKLNDQLKTIDRSQYNDQWIIRATYIMFLNRNCFNGLYRVNFIGEFNVPFANYAKPIIVDQINLIECNKLLQNVNIGCMGYEDSINIIKPNSFVYLNPPYKPLTKFGRLNMYYTNKFDDNAQINLANSLKNKINDNSIKIMLSNSNPKIYNPSDDFFEQIYGDHFNIKYVFATRCINSNSQERTKISEVVIRNYD